MTAMIQQPDTAALRDREQHIRPVNLRTDLAALADLIELVFAANMDEGGRAAIREMRTLSRMGAGMTLFSRLNMMTQGISMGYVWMEDTRLVGNVSIYPVEYPYHTGHTWIIANVGVHPDFRRMGIAHQLMETTLQNIRGRGGKEVILQVDYDNVGAVALYERLGFVRQRAWVTWRRSRMSAVPRNQPSDDFFITRRRPAEWRDEYALVERLRSSERGGIGWTKPLHEHYFHKSFWQRLTDWFTMQSVERLIIRDDDNQLKTVLWATHSPGGSSTRMNLFVDAVQYPAETDAMLHYALRRFRNSAMLLEHPLDDEPVTDLLKKYRFTQARRVWHMVKWL
ncbi:MAG: GNAT family N-acetyltransferase [Aggregatilineales bacterium]